MSTKTSKKQKKQTQQPQSERVTHDFTNRVREAIDQHGNALIKEIDAHYKKEHGDSLIRYVHYRTRGLQSMGRIGRMSVYSKGIVILTGTVEEALASLSEENRADIQRRCFEFLTQDLKGEADMSSRKLLLQMLNQQIQEGINEAMEAAGHDPFVWEEEFETRSENNGTAFTQIFYDGWMPSEEQVERIQKNNREAKARRMQTAGLGQTVDVSDADYTS